MFHTSFGKRKHQPHPGRALVAGLAGGLVGVMAMTAAQEAMRQAMALAQAQREGEMDEEQDTSQEDPTTVKAADQVVRHVIGRPLAPHEKPMAGQIVHYGFGTLMGGIYGILAEYVPWARVGEGLGFGFALFVVADEVAVPAVGLSGSPLEAKPSTHLYALVAHLVYGGVCEGARGVVRRLLG